MSEIRLDAELCVDHGQIGSNVKIRGGGIREIVARMTRAYNSGAGHSLHCGLSAPPTASQASVPGVARERHIML